MTSYLTKFKLISNEQHGFRTGRSTQIAVISFVEIIYNSLDEGLQVAGVFFDLTRTFDCISFQFILSKIYNLGLRSIFLELMHIYITKRTMQVKIDDCWSSEYKVEMGVPQRGVLEPTVPTVYF